MATTKTASLEEKVLDYVEATGAILEKSGAMLAANDAQAKQCEALIPAAVEALASNGRIEPHQRKEAAEALKNPATVLELLIKTAGHRNDAERAKIGEPAEKTAGTKQANYSSLHDGYVGRRSRPDEPESNKAFKRGLGF